MALWGPNEQQRRQKLSFSVALVHDPKIVFLDEPTGGVDPITRREFWTLIYEAAHRGTTVFVTTHYMDEAEQLCDRLMVMDKGSIMAEDSPAGLIKKFSTKEVLEVRFGSERNSLLSSQLESMCERIEVLPDRILMYADDAENILENIRRSGLHPNTSLVRRSSLEDVFLRLTGRSLVE